jgi:hypothetical protein
VVGASGAKCEQCLTKYHIVLAGGSGLCCLLDLEACVLEIPDSRSFRPTSWRKEPRPETRWLGGLPLPPKSPLRMDDGRVTEWWMADANPPRATSSVLTKCFTAAR